MYTETYVLIWTYNIVFEKKKRLTSYILFPLYDNV